MSARDYRVRKSQSKGQYVLNRRNGFIWASGWIQPTGKLEKRQASKLVRRYKYNIPDGMWYKRITSVFYWS